jgi:hypothetical protein
VRRFTHGTADGFRLGPCQSRHAFGPNVQPLEAGRIRGAASEAHALADVAGKINAWRRGHVASDVAITLQKHKGRSPPLRGRIALQFANCTCLSTATWTAPTGDGLAASIGDHGKNTQNHTQVDG